MLTALGLGLLAASSLLIGAVLGVVRVWSDVLVGVVLAFGAGALIASIAFELTEEGARVGGLVPVALGLAAGALTYFLADRLVERIGGRAGGSTAGLPLALGALLDGIPEQAVLGIGIAGGGGASIALLAAIFVSNLPEAMGSASDMRRAGTPVRHVFALWAAVTVICVLATVAGLGLAAWAGPRLQASVNGFAAGALLVMLVDSMIPESVSKAGRWAGLAAVLGFAVAVGLSAISL